MCALAAEVRCVRPAWPQVRSSVYRLQAALENYLVKNLNIFVPHCSGLLTDSRPHGDGLVAHGFISRLADRGHTLYVAAEQIDLSRPLPPNVHLFPISGKGSGPALRRISYALQVRSLFSRLRRQVRFDLAHQLNPVYTGLSLSLLGTGIPIVLGPYVADWPFDPHAMASSRLALRLLMKQTKRSLAFLQQRCADTLILTTQAARQRVIGQRTNESSIQILPHGINSDLFSPAPLCESQNGAQTEEIILFYANVSERKGVFDLLRAFDRLASDFPRVRLWIAGDGDELSLAKDAAASLRSSRQIEFLGRQSQEQAVQLLQSASVYCLPSHGEPYGMTVAEAMSCGLPVVTTDAGGVKWLVDDEGGVRVPVKRPDLLAEALAGLLANPSRRNAMGVHNRTKVVSNMSWNKVVDRLEEIYAITLAARQNATSRSGQLTVTSIGNI